jgi:hypothetical protein
MRGILRKLSLEFKPELIAIGRDLKAVDAYLYNLQDKKLHADVADALAAIGPKTADAALAPAVSAPEPADELRIFESVSRPSWIYDALKRLTPTRFCV